MFNKKLSLILGVLFLTFSLLGASFVFILDNQGEQITAQETTSCDLVFDKNATFADDLSYMQVRNVRLYLSNASKDANGFIKLAANSKIYTNGDEYNLKKGYGSITNGLKSIKLSSDSNINPSYYTSYTSLDNLKLNTSEGNIWECGVNQYPPRYFSINFANETKLNNLVVKCSGVARQNSFENNKFASRQTTGQYIVNNIDFPKMKLEYRDTFIVNGNNQTIKCRFAQINDDNTLNVIDLLLYAYHFDGSGYYLYTQEQIDNPNNIPGSDFAYFTNWKTEPTFYITYLNHYVEFVK